LSIKLKAYTFSGPYLLEDWQPEDAAGVFAILTKLDPVNKPTVYSVIYVEETASFDRSGFPWSHSLARSWLREAKLKKNVYIAYCLLPRSTREKRNQICEYLIREFHLICNLIK